MLNVNSNMFYMNINTMLKSITLKYNNVQIIILKDKLRYRIKEGIVISEGYFNLTNDNWISVVRS